MIIKLYVIQSLKGESYYIILYSFPMYICNVMYLSFGSLIFTMTMTIRYRFAPIIRLNLYNYFLVYKTILRNITYIMIIRYLFNFISILLIIIKNKILISSTFVAKLLIDMVPTIYIISINIFGVLF